MRGDFLERNSYASRCCLYLCSSTKTSILCSESLKTGVPDPKKAQKYRFCARNARKRGSRRQIKHKNLDFVLGKPENQGKTAHSDTKTPILCSKCPKMRVPKPKSAQKPRFCAREDGKVASGSVKVAFLQITAHVLKTQIPHNQIINF